MLHLVSWELKSGPFRESLVGLEAVAILDSIDYSMTCFLRQHGQREVQLPSNCRPKKRLIFNLNNHKKTARVDVLRNGQVRWIRGGKDHGWISLGGIVFSTARGVALRTINGWRS